MRKNSLLSFMKSIQIAPSPLEISELYTYQRTLNSNISTNILDYSITYMVHQAKDFNALFPYRLPTSWYLLPPNSLTICATTSLGSRGMRPSTR